jgi:hypothetical protein
MEKENLAYDLDLIMSAIIWRDDEILVHRPFGLVLNGNLRFDENSSYLPFTIRNMF